MLERRKLRRKPLIGQMKIFAGDVLQDIGEGFVVNLNEEGVRIITPQALPLGQEL
jgi:hypothetical protein